ncbi:MAG: hypothetical protein HZC43_03485 [Nitrosomonadales bacterium]|nr:hypothetical protein [Nitrosomonadales bacterium]
MKLAMPVSPYPTFPRTREKGQTNRYASFALAAAPVFFFRFLPLRHPDAIVNDVIYSRRAHADFAREAICNLLRDAGGAEACTRCLIEANVLASTLVTALDNTQTKVCV